MIALLVLLFCYLRRHRAGTNQNYPNLCSRHRQQRQPHALLYVHQPTHQGLTEHLYWQHYNPRNSQDIMDLEEPVPAYTEHIPEWNSVYNPTTASLNEYVTDDTAKLVV